LTRQRGTFELDIGRGQTALQLYFNLDEKELAVLTRFAADPNAPARLQVYQFIKYPIEPPQRL